MHILKDGDRVVETSAEPIVWSSAAGGWVLPGLVVSDAERRYTVEPCPADAARQTLANLDHVLPRIAEDIIDALGPDYEALLPQVIRDRLAAKRAARAIIAGAS